jgi:hypothetical protein
MRLAVMAEKDEIKKLLWMFREPTPAAKPGEVDLDPVDEIYHLQQNTRNPYLKRAIAPAVRKLERSPEDLQKLVRVFSGQEGYEVTPSNQDTPYLRRSLSHPSPPPAAQPKYLDPNAMPGDTYKLPWLINDFFKSVLARLKANPGEFDGIVEELVDLFNENRITIKLYEAYYTFRDWDHLMETLEEVSRYPSPETFDLFCSALFAYYELVYPPEEG